jgi:hypothetical protein
MLVIGCGKFGYDGVGDPKNGSGQDAPDAAPADQGDFPFAGTVDWGIDIGDGHGHGMVADPAGNIYFAGHFSQALNIGTSSLPPVSAGQQDFLVAKFDKDGNELWVTSFGGANRDEAWSMALGPSGALYIAGSYQDGAFFDDIQLASNGSFDAVVVKVDAIDGAVEWAVPMGGPNEDHGMSVAVDGSENVYLAGVFHDDATFPDGDRTGVLDDIFVTSLTSAGDLRWVKTIGANGDDEPLEIKATGDRIAMVGHFSNEVTFGPDVLTSNGNEDLFVTVFDSSGNIEWARSAGSVGEDNGAGVGFDQAGNVYFAGRVNGSVDLGFGPVAGFGDSDGLVGSYSATGELRWAHGMGDAAFERPLAMVVTSTGECYVTGNYEGQFQVQGETLDSQGGEDIFLIAFDSGGLIEGIRSFGGAGNEVGFALGIDNEDNLLLTAIYNGDIVIGDDTFSDNWGTFIARLVPDSLSL